MLNFHYGSRRRVARRGGSSRAARPCVDVLEGRLLMAAALTATSVPLSPAPVEGQSFTGVVAHFTDADQNTDPSAYAVSIHWGDGKTSLGVVTADPKGGFDVSGTHTYASPGAFRITAQIADTDADATSVSTTNVVSEAAITAAGAVVNMATKGPLHNVVVATFTDADPALRAAAFSATIDWGDGRTSTGRIVADRNGFAVLGSHKYAAPGAYAITVSIRQGTANSPSQFVTESDLISDGSIAADHVDPLLVNPWGLVSGPRGPFWDSNNGSGTSSLYDGAGNVSTGLPFVTVPAPAGSPPGTTSAPTGIVFNGTPGFVVSFTNAQGVTTSGPAAFIFATEDGTISGWNPKVSPTGSSPSVQAVLEVDNSASGAVYKGLAEVAFAGANEALPAGDYLFATNFHSGNIDVFDSNFQPVALPAGAFTDPNIPAGYAPFGIAAIGNTVYVTYAKQDAAKHDDVAGPGNGFVDAYSLTGSLMMRLGGPGVQPELNSPWAVVQAPGNFGAFSNDILVGNFGDSHISAFDPATGAFLGQFADAQGHPIVLAGGEHGADTKGLWGLAFGNGNGNGSGNTSTLYFNTGFNDEQDGLFGSLTAGSEASATASTIVAIAPSGLRSSGNGWWKH